MKEIWFDKNKYKLSCNLVNYLVRKFKKTTQEIFEELFSHYSELFEESCFCRVTKNLLYDKIRFNKKNWSYYVPLPIKNWFPRYSKYFYTTEIVTYGENLGLGPNIILAYYSLVEKQNSFEHITRQDVLDEYQKEFTGENSVLGKCKSKSIEKFQVACKKISDKKKIFLCDESNNPFSKKYWQKKGLTDSESQKIVDERNQWKKEFWEKRGNDEYKSNEIAKRINPSFYETEKQKQEILKRTPIYKEYWIERGYDKNEAKTKMVAFRITHFSYWEKLGFNFEEAKIKAKENNPFSLNYWLSKGKSEEDFYLWIEKKQKTIYSGTSKSANIFFKTLLEKINDKSKIITYCLTGYEKRLGRYFFDFIDENKKLIIEYNGDIFHGNPKYYKPEDTPHPFNSKITVQEMWSHDEKRKKFVEGLGYEIIYVWYSDNKEDELKKILKTYYLCE